MECQIDGDQVILRPVCPICGKRFKIRVKWEDFQRWKQGELIQICFPDLKPEERELLISGVCPDCWNDTFEDMDEIWHK